jgi:hypothetical protein
MAKLNDPDHERRHAAGVWTGWRRRFPGGIWQVVCRAEDIGECHRQLLELANGRVADRVITRGAYPREG